MTKEQLLEQAKPILFNTEMVRAILDNRKSCTRRIVKGYIPKDAIFGYTLFTPDGCISCRGTFEDGYGEKPFWQSYHRGDILYVRETWRDHSPGFKNHYIYKADYPDEYAKEVGYKPSIHMPKAAARIFLKVTDVRVERLQDITEEQAKLEGAIDNRGHIHSPNNEYDRIHSAREHFAIIWNSTIPKAEQSSYSWEANPWVWVIEFERVIPED